MRSVRLSKDTRYDILKAIIERWEAQNPPPCDIEAEEAKTGDVLYKMAYSVQVRNATKKIPEDMLRWSHRFKFSIAGKVDSILMTEKKPVRRQHSFNDDVQINFQDVPEALLDFSIKKEVHDKWKESRDDFYDKVRIILNSINTTKQLVDAWPEAEKYIPEYAKSAPIKTLPALKTEELNAALGVKS